MPPVTGAARERVGRIARAARRTASVVEALLFLGRDDSVIAPVSVDLRAVVNDTVEVYLPIAQAKGIALHAAYGDEQVVTVPAGAASIVLQNLIENAIRYTDSGHVRVTLGARPADRRGHGGRPGGRRQGDGFSSVVTVAMPATGRVSDSTSFVESANAWAGECPSTSAPRVAPDSRSRLRPTSGNAPS